MLAPDPATSDESGDLTIEELATYRLSADLVVLSACETGAGTFVPGEGVLGLPSALRRAGARSVAQTLLPISDEHTAKLTARFFEHLHDGVPARSALTRSKREALAGRLGEALRAPRFWAPVLIYGR